MTAPTAPGRTAPRQGTPPARASYREVLGSAEFRAIFVANIVSMLGSVVAAVALTVLVYQQTRSPAVCPGAARYGPVRLARSCHSRWPALRSKARHSVQAE